jgi:hypothetical protein
MHSSWRMASTRVHTLLPDEHAHRGTSLPIYKSAAQFHGPQIITLINVTIDLHKAFGCRCMINI